MFKHLNLVTLFALTTMGLSSPASANLILLTYGSGSATPTNIGSYNMTDFAFSGIEVGSTSGVNSPISGSLGFEDVSNNSMLLNRNTADNVSWWNNGESSNYDIFTTDEHLVTILLPENTFAFSFNVSADLEYTGNNAWITATETDGPGINSQHNFNVSKENTPGFGIYADNSNGNCSTLSSVTIEPDYWGVGNFSINQGSCTKVPEPSSLALLALGVIGLGFTHRKNKI